MAKALLEEETIDAKAVENLHKYGTTKAPDETEAPTASHMLSLIHICAVIVIAVVSFFFGRD